MDSPNRALAVRRPIGARSERRDVLEYLNAMVLPVAGDNVSFAADGEIFQTFEFAALGSPAAERLYEAPVRLQRRELDWSISLQPEFAKFATRAND